MYKGRGDNRDNRRNNEYKDKDRKYYKFLKNKLTMSLVVMMKKLSMLI